MKKSFLRRTMIAFILGVSVLFCIAQYVENIDPHDDNSQYAYGENIGWLNFEPSEGPGVTVTDTEVTGFVWAENIGWINLSPTTYGGVTNDGSGNLGGYAWGENIGWINFNPTGGGVTIDNEGDFDGWAWGENIGWIHFQNLSVPYKVQTAWSAEVIVQNTLTIAAGTGGTTDPAPGTHNYDEGTDVPITATPDTNNRFSGWTGDVPSGHENDNPITITMDSDKSITANFSPIPCTLTIAAGTGGTTNPEPGSHIYDYGTQASVTAVPSSGYQFSGWSGDASGTATTITITMDSDKSITANFSAVSTGDGDGDGKKSGCFIATATYGSPFHPYVKILRDFRDKYLMPGKLGRKLVELYYKYSPYFADLIVKNKVLKVVVRINLLPLVVLGYAMVYFGPIITAVIFVFIFILPIFLILFVRKKIEPTGSQRP